MIKLVEITRCVDCPEYSMDGFNVRHKYACCRLTQRTIEPTDALDSIHDECPLPTKPEGDTNGTDA